MLISLTNETGSGRSRLLFAPGRGSESSDRGLSGVLSPKSLHLYREARPGGKRPDWRAKRKPLVGNSPRKPMLLAKEKGDSCGARLAEAGSRQSTALDDRSIVNPTGSMEDLYRSLRIAFERRNLDVRVELSRL